MLKFRKSALLLASLVFFSPTLFNNNCSVYAQEQNTVSEEAKALYQEALDYQKKSKMSEAIDCYIKALRKDRTVLAFDDNGLIEASYAASVEKLKESPDDIRLLEVCGFLASVGFSDNKTAIGYYEKILELVDDEGVKNRTQILIGRLSATMQAQQEYDSAVISSMRDERIKSWAEMEKVDEFAEKQAKASDLSERLNDAYTNRESLQNKVPQLEEELNELQESYDKADRLWYTLKDELYERRRRRLKNDIAAKKEELENAKKELKSAEKEVTKLEKEDEKMRREEEESAFNSEEETPEDEDSAFNSDPSSSRPTARTIENNNRSSENEYEDEYSEEALSKQADEISDDERQEQLNDLIDNL